MPCWHIYFGKNISTLDWYVEFCRTILVKIWRACYYFQILLRVFSWLVVFLFSEYRSNFCNVFFFIDWKTKMSKFWKYGDGSVIRFSHFFEMNFVSGLRQFSQIIFFISSSFWNPLPYKFPLIIFKYLNLTYYTFCKYLRKIWRKI